MAGIILSGGLAVYLIARGYVLAGKADAIAADLTLQNKELNRQLSLCRSSHERIYEALAKKLHDEIGGEISAAKLMLTPLSRNLYEEDFALFLRVDKMLERIAAQARDISHDLYPSSLRVVGLNDTLQELCLQYHAPKSLAVEYSFVGRVQRLPQGHEEVIFRSVKELLINAQKHSSAWVTHVNANWQEKELEISITDNGMGMPITKLDFPGAGHRLIQGGMSSIGGSFVVHRPLKGFMATLKYRIAS